jgi:hypothetical protein
MWLVVPAFAVIALVVLAYYFTQSRRKDVTWEMRRQRYSVRSVPPGQSIEPQFRFDDSNPMEGTPHREPGGEDSA